MPKTSADYQRDYIAAKKAQGLKRIVLWLPPEDVETFQLAAQQPHAMRKLQARIRTGIEPGIRGRVEAELTRKTRRAMLAQKRAQVRRQQAGSNRPPEMIRFKARPPAVLRNRLKDAGWLYDPVATVWHLPDDPEVWPATERLLDELDGYGIERLVVPLCAALTPCGAIRGSRPTRRFPASGAQPHRPTPLLSKFRPSQ